MDRECIDKLRNSYTALEAPRNRLIRKVRSSSRNVARDFVKAEVFLKVDVSTV